MATKIATRVASGLARPVFVTAPPGDHKRLFIVEQHSGRIKILDLASGAVKPDPFLTVGPVGTANEQGLLGLAFHPNYASNGFFFVYLVDPTKTTHIRRYKVSSTDPDKADLGSATTVLTFPRPFANHNGGWIGFGPKDGFLYVASGDGGSEGDPQRNGQKLNVLLAKLLRIDVDHDDFPGDDSRNYAIPPSNPFRGRADARPETWAYGLRNPWRCSFDRDTGDLYIGDVGQDRWEEIDFQPASSKGGENYGWRFREGKHDSGLEPAGTGGPFVDPIHEYGHDLGIAVIGGYVYRGQALADLKGAYLFADVSGSIWSLRRANDGSVASVTPLQDELFPSGPPSSISSFGEDAAGELYVVSLTPGEVYRIGPAPVRTHAAARRAAGPTLEWVRPKADALAPLALDEVAPKLSPEERAVKQVGYPQVLGVSAVEEARLLLQTAAAVEHALLVQYLYALYSLDTTSQPTSPWVDELRGIVKEEMGHLVTVQNLLLAIGGKPFFERDLGQAFPPSGRFDPFPFNLEPLTLTALAKFVTAESPLPEQLPPGMLARAMPAYQLARLSVSKPNGGTASGGAAPTPDVGINHVGVLYMRLYWLFQEDERSVDPWPQKPGVFPNRHLKPQDVVPSQDPQADTDETGQGTDNDTSPFKGEIYVKKITSLSDARTALAFIAAQGEGWLKHPIPGLSHFERFLGIFEDFPRQLEAGWEPTLLLPVNPTTGDQPLPDRAAERNRITHPGSRLWADLFDVRYQMLLAKLALALSLPHSDPLRNTLFTLAIATEMKRALKQIALRLATLPRKPDDTTGPAALRRAGPPFRMPDAPLPGDGPGLRVFLKARMADSAQLSTKLQSQDNPIPLTPQDKSLLSALKSADAALTSAGL